MRKLAATLAELKKFIKRNNDTQANLQLPGLSTHLDEVHYTVHFQKSKGGNLEINTVNFQTWHSCKAAEKNHSFRIGKKREGENNPNPLHTFWNYQRMNLIKIILSFSLLNK